MTELLLSTNIQFKSVTGNSLFYCNWEYSCCLTVDCIAAARPYGTDIFASPKRISEVVNRWTYPLHSTNTLVPIILGKITTVRLFLEKYDPASFKLVFSGNLLRIYTNDLQLLQAIEDNPHVAFSIKQFSKITVSNTPGVITLTRPKYKYRTYFRNYSFTASASAGDKFVSWVKSTPEIKLSPSLTARIYNTTRGLHRVGFSTVRDTHFFDHSDMQNLTMLGLMFPSIIRKTLPIVQAK